jgi:alpha-beta hydrolase superfamily lysophospholipase
MEKTIVASDAFRAAVGRGTGARPSRRHVTYRWGAMPTLQAADGVALHVRTWEPDGSPRGTIVLVHGLGEHAGRYVHVAEALTADGWRITAHDHRGHGASKGPRGGLAKADDLLDDLALVIDQERGDGPLVLLGHSLGGAVAGRFVAEGLDPAPAPWHRPVDALVMTSPALDLGMNPAQRALLAVLGPVAPTLAVGNGLKPEWISRDPAVVQAYKDDPLVHNKVTARLVRFLVDSGNLVRERAGSWTVPTLLLWAGADRCVAPAGSAAFAAAAPEDMVVSKTYPDSFHEILNEPDQVEVIDEIRRWLDQRGFSQ